jgi:hypothetical protein
MIPAGQPIPVSAPPTDVDLASSSGSLPPWLQRELQAAPIFVDNSDKEEVVVDQIKTLPRKLKVEEVSKVLAERAPTLKRKGAALLQDMGLPEPVITLKTLSTIAARPRPSLMWVVGVVEALLTTALLILAFLPCLSQSRYAGCAVFEPIGVQGLAARPAGHGAVAAGQFSTIPNASLAVAAKSEGQRCGQKPRTSGWGVEG